MELTFLGGLEKLTVSDWAAWVQAIGTLLAIFFSARIAIKQSKLQFESSLKLQKFQDAEKRLILTESVLSIFKNAVASIKYVKNELSTRQAVYEVATKRKYYDLDMLTDVLNTLRQIPIHDLPSPTLVTSVMVAIPTIRQLDIQINKALLESSKMDADDYDKLFLTIEEIYQSMTKTHKNVQSIFEDAKQKSLTEE